MDNQVDAVSTPKAIDDSHDGDDDKTHPKTILVLQRSGSFETADITNPGTPSSNASRRDNMDKSNNPEGLPITPSNESPAGFSSNDGNFIFEDKDDENYVHDNNDKIKIDYSENDIQSKVELELNGLFEKLKSKKADRLAVAKGNLGNTVAEENSSDSNKAKAPTPMKRGRFSALVYALITVLFGVYWVFSKDYCHDTAMVQAQAFFGKSSSMEGITVVLSETTSRIGSTIGHRFARLGATVESLQDGINCNDLDSVSTSIDSLITKHKGVDFLVHTGNLCLDHNIESLTSLEPTVQGYDALVGGNYLSAFLASQKILPSLEKSKYGTLVQFTSKSSSLVNESHLQSELESLSPSNIFPRMSSFFQREEKNNILTRLLYLPLRFVSVKMFEIAQHRVLTQAYPNIRTFEISSGWIGIGESPADELFHRIFQTEDEEENSPLSSSENADLQENLYELSQNAVWKWVVPPSTLPPITEMILGSPPTRQVLERSKQKRPSASIARYLPNTATVVTSGALVLLAMKTTPLSWRNIVW